MINELCKVTFECTDCGIHCYVEFESDSCGDNLNYHCQSCGAYYKKFIRIPEENILSYGRKVIVCPKCNKDSEGCWCGTGIGEHG